MEKVLLVDDDVIFLKIILRQMQKYEGQFEAFVARNGVEAVEVLERETITVVVTDLMMPEMDGLELLAHVTRHYPRIPFIVITGCESDELKRWPDPRDKIQLLEKPVDFHNLAWWIIEWLDRIDEGQFPPGISVGMALQLIRVQGKTCTLEISHGRNGKGYFHFYKGVLNDAHYRDRQGENAAVDMSGWGRVYLRFKDLPREKRERRIKRGFVELFSDGPVREGEAAPIDRERTNSGGRGEKEAEWVKSRAFRKKTEEMELLSRAILMAEQGCLNGARKILERLLEMNPRNLGGWLWQSRIDDDLDAMESSLEKAAAISPEDPGVVEEIRKLAITRNTPRGGAFRRCLFCWCAVEKMTPVCPYCKCHLHVHDGFFTSARGGRRDVLEEAILRYERIPGERKDFNAHHSLGMAWLNLENWEEGLHQFYEASRRAHENEYMLAQLKTLLGHAPSMVKASGEKPHAHEEKSTRAAPPPREFGIRNVLVMEADSTTRLVVSLALKRDGRVVLEAEDGLEALSRLDEERPGEALLDVVLPGMNGVRTFMERDMEHKSMPIIMRTAGDDFPGKVNERMADFGEEVGKPFDPEKRVRVVKKHLFRRFRKKSE